jgi:hypothetical protein
MKYTPTKQLLAQFAAKQIKSGILPFDSIEFEFNDDSNYFVDCTATKNGIEVNTLWFDTDLLIELFQLALKERDQTIFDMDTYGVTISGDLTEAQVKAIIRKYKQNPDGSPNLQHFFNRVGVGSEYAGISWCGMFLGIEKDGYTHS